MKVGSGSLSGGVLWVAVAVGGSIASSCGAATEEEYPVGGQEATGGVTPGLGGGAPLGGEVGVGGAPIGGGPVGGQPAGGAQHTGGVQAAGGVQSTGGVQGNTGGAQSTGGVQGNTGGVQGNTGGVQGNTGGVRNTGGVQSDTGGAQNTGGTAVVCTDVSPDSTPCETWASWGNCGSSWFQENDYCMESCGECGGGSTGGASGSGGSQNTGGGSTGGGGSVDTPTPITNPTPGHFTHYWDCCKPSCAWPDKGTAKSCGPSGEVLSNRDTQSACAGGSAYQCWSMAPWELSSTLAYGFAAFNEGACGTCYQIEFTGTTSSGYDDPGSASLRGKVMIVQKLNTGGIGGGQFDLLVPGGGVGDFDACSSSWGSSDLGERYGGFFLQCRNQNSGNHDAAKSCARSKCEQVFAGKSQLLAGCLWWVEWADLADNPNFNYQQVSCPAALSTVSGM